MALNREKVGTVYPSYPYEVSREKIHEYAIAVGEKDPRYTSDGADCVAPPTFAACFTITRGSEPVHADPEVGTHRKLVHGSQSFRLGRPLRPGDRLVCTPSILAISARGGNEMMTIEVDCRFEDGTHAVTAEAVLVFLDSAPQDDTPPDDSGGVS